MPDIDPASLHRPEPLQTSLNPSSLSLSKPNAISSTTAAPKAAKATAAAKPQRVDIEPIYTSLKAAVGEYWGDYKDAIGKYVIGKLNQSELELEIDHFIGASPETEHLHNSLIAAIYANAYREPPEPGVAPWVAANDKPIGGIGGGGVGKGGDKMEERLRREVMALPRRDRKRLKEVGERDGYDPNTSSAAASAMTDYRLARSIKLPDTVPASAGGLNKTNWDLEIRKRYTNPLFQETLEFPDATSIQTRLVPICYEEALPNGAADLCAEFMATAAEMFVKDVVGTMIAKTRSNITSAGAQIGIWTKNRRGPQHHAHAHAHAHHKKGRQVNGGPSNGGDMMETPQQQLSQRPLGISEVRIALSLASCSLGPMPDIVTDVMGGWPEGYLEGWETHQPVLDLELPPEAGESALTNGMRGHVKHVSSSAAVVANGASATNNVGLMTNGAAAAPVNGKALEDHQQAQASQSQLQIAAGKESIAEWAGSSAWDRQQLFGVLHDCLAIGQ